MNICIEQEVRIAMSDPWNEDGRFAEIIMKGIGLSGKTNNKLDKR